MSANRGKDFEGVIKDCLLKVPDIDVQRLYDTTNGFAGVKQPSDFSVYLFPYKYYLCWCLKNQLLYLDYLFFQLCLNKIHVSAVCLMFSLLKRLFSHGIVFNFT